MQTIDIAVHLDLLEGYLDLGMFEEARAQLELLEDVPESAVPMGPYRVALWAGEERWHDAARCALSLCELEPDAPQHFLLAAAAQRGLGLPGAGVDLLLNGPPALRALPDFHYEIARDHLRFDEIYAATLALREAIALDPATCDRAAADPDFESLWDRLPDLKPAESVEDDLPEPF